MIVKPASCGGCALWGNGRGFSYPSGEAAHKVILVGEALGEDEELVGRPFVGKAGRVLDRLIERTVDPRNGLPFRRQDFLVDNVIRCRPPANKITGEPYEHSSIAKCSSNLDGTLRAAQPRVALALGNQALRRLTGQWGIDQLRGYCFTGAIAPTVIGTYHPAYIARGNWHLARVFQADLLRAVHIAEHGRPTADYAYVQHPTPQSIEAFERGYHEAWEANKEVVLSCDIETPYDDEEEKDEDIVAIEDRLSYNILRISFSYKPFEAITLPWTGPYRLFALRMLALHRAKVWWNGLSFDIPRLLADGAEVNGDQFDGMHAWQALEPQQRRGLGSVATWYCPDMEPWKLTQKFANKEWYSCADADVALRCFLGIRSALQKQGRWEMFLTHFVKCYGVLIKMTQRGVLTDRELRKAASLNLLSRFEQVKTDLQSQVPTELRPRKIFKKNEEQLKKLGSWREGKMIVVEEEAELRPNQEVVEGWITTKKKPTKSTKRPTTCGTTEKSATPPGSESSSKPKRTRKKKGSSASSAETGSTEVPASATPSAGTSDG